MNKDHTSHWITTLLAAFCAVTAIVAGHLAAYIAAPTGTGHVLLIFVGWALAFRAVLLAIAGLIVLVPPIAAAMWRV